MNAQYAYETNDVDWLAHIDIDELIVSDIPLAEELTHMPAGIHRIKLNSQERVYLEGNAPVTLFDGMFRINRDVGIRAERQIHGSTLPFTTQGFCGHVAGKSLTKTGRDVLIGIHSPRLFPGSKAGFIRGIDAGHSRLLHFDGLTPLHWTSKLFRYANNDHYINDSDGQQHRQKLLDFVRANKDDPLAFAKVHRRLKTVSSTPKTQLATLGFLRAETLSIQTALAQMGWQDIANVSADRYDDSLVKTSPEMAQLRAAMMGEYANAS